MSRTRTIGVLFPVAIMSCLMLALAAGCSSQKYEPAEETAGDLRAAAGELSADEGRVQNTLTALNNLVNSTEGDLRPKYRAFSDSLDKLTESAKRTEAKADEMRKAGQKYFTTWDKEAASIKNEDIRARSEDRKSEVKEQFQRVSDLYQQAKGQFMPFHSDLQDIRKALGTDLTPGGLDSIRPTAKRATSEGKDLQETIRKLSDEFTKLGVKMSPSGTR